MSEFINFQNPFYGLSVDEAANFAGEKNTSEQTPEQKLENQYEILELLSIEEENEHYLPPKTEHNHSRFMLDEEDLLDKEQKSLLDFGSVLARTKINERDANENVGALK